jgi:hypothetical protein
MHQRQVHQEEPSRAWHVVLAVAAPQQPGGEPEYVEPCPQCGHLAGLAGPDPAWPAHLCVTTMALSG